MPNGTEKLREEEINAIMSGGTEGVLRFLVTSALELNSNGCAQGRDDRERIAALEVRKSEGDGKFMGSFTFGKMIKSKGAPAIILSIFIGLPVGIGIFQYYHAQSVAAVVKQEAKQEAAVVATETSKREHGQLNRDLVKTLILEEIQMLAEKEDKKSKPGTNSGERDKHESDSIR